MKKMKSNINKILISTFIISYSCLAIASTNLEEGIKKYNSGDYKEAIEFFDKAAKENPNDPIPHKWLSKTYEALFDLENSMKENEIFQKLKNNQNKNKGNNYQDKKDEIKNQEEIDGNDKFKVDPIDDDFIEKAIALRNKDNLQTTRYLEFKEIKTIFNTVPLDSDVLLRFNKNFEIKVYYDIANHQESILFYKSKAALLELDIEALKYEFLTEKDFDKKLVLEKKINDYIKEYKKCQDKLVELINKPILNNTDSLSFEYYQISGKDSSEYIKFLEEKKDVFKIALENVSKQVNNYKNIILPQEKELNNLISKIDKKIFLKPVEELSGYEYEIVSKINNLKKKIKNDKLNLLFYSIELNILIDAYNKTNETIKKIDPSYSKIDTFKLPKKEKILDSEEK